MFGERTETDRETATLHFEISAVWDTKPRTTRQKTFRLIMGTEQVTKPKACETHDDEDDDDDEVDVDICHLNVCVILNGYRDRAV
jgi:hypothetical protein